MKREHDQDLGNTGEKYITEKGDESNHRGKAGEILFAEICYTIETVSCKL